MGKDEEGTNLNILKMNSQKYHSENGKKKIKLIIISIYRDKMEVSGQFFPILYYVGIDEQDVVHIK